VSNVVSVAGMCQVRQYNIYFLNVIWQEKFGTWYLSPFGIQPPTSFSHMLGSWLRGFSEGLRKSLVGAATLCWAI
jgi:hypothetical protein